MENQFSFGQLKQTKSEALLKSSVPRSKKKCLTPINTALDKLKEFFKSGLAQGQQRLKARYDAEVYPNCHGQICPKRSSRVRFYYVNTLKVQQYCGK